MEKLYQACCELPCDLSKVRRLLATTQYTSSDLMRTAVQFVDWECFCESRDFVEDKGRKAQAGELHTHYLYQVLELFLEFGLDPNESTDNSNIMSCLGYVDNDYDGANCLRLLLEHGGDPNLVVEGESIFDYLMFRVNYDLGEYDIDYWDSLVHQWFVLLGFGGRWSSSGKIPVEMKNGHSIEELRMHEQIAYFLEPWPDKPECWTMHIVRKETGEEIAVS